MYKLKKEGLSADPWGTSLETNPFYPTSSPTVITVVGLNYADTIAAVLFDFFLWPRPWADLVVLYHTRFSDRAPLWMVVCQRCSSAVLLRFLFQWFVENPADSCCFGWSYLTFWQWAILLFSCDVAAELSVNSFSDHQARPFCRQLQTGVYIIAELYFVAHHIFQIALISESHFAHCTFQVSVKSSSGPVAFHIGALFIASAIPCWKLFSTVKGIC